MTTPGLNVRATPALDIAWVRSQFPSLKTQVNGQTAAFLYGPAGTQVPTQVMHAIQSYFLSANANTCGAVPTSPPTEEILPHPPATLSHLLHSPHYELA